MDNEKECLNFTWWPFYFILFYFTKSQLFCLPSKNILGDFPPVSPKFSNQVMLLFIIPWQLYNYYRLTKKMFNRRVPKVASSVTVPQPVWNPLRTLHWDLDVFLFPRRIKWKKERQAGAASQVYSGFKNPAISCCQVFPFALVRHQSVEADDPVHLLQMSVNRRWYYLSEWSGLSHGGE